MSETHENIATEVVSRLVSLLVSYSQDLFCALAWMFESWAGI